MWEGTQGFLNKGNHQLDGSSWVHSNFLLPCISRRGIKATPLIPHSPGRSDTPAQTSAKEDKEGCGLSYGNSDIQVCPQHFKPPNMAMCCVCFFSRWARPSTPPGHQKPQTQTPHGPAQSIGSRATASQSSGGRGSALWCASTALLRTWRRPRNPLPALGKIQKTSSPYTGWTLGLVCRFGGLVWFGGLAVWFGLVACMLNTFAMWLQKEVNFNSPNYQPRAT